MKKTEFNAVMNSLKTTKGPKKGLLDLEKLKNLPEEQKKELAKHIVKYRGPLLLELIEGLDRTWLASMGYLYKTTSHVCPEYKFLHTCEHKIR